MITEERTSTLAEVGDLGDDLEEDSEAEAHSGAEEEHSVEVCTFF